ncbi:MAG: hypothetical protein ABL999_14240 [Pyrinomonadaceae bacterium]
MKKYFLIFAFMFVTVFGAVSASAQCDPNSLSPIKCSYYNEGYQDGANDARSGQSNDYKRYKNKYERKYEDNYRDGYNAGFSSVGYGGGSNASGQVIAYDRGYWLGGSDVRTNIRRNYKNYSGQYDRKFERDFRDGYNDGYDYKARKYPAPDRPGAVYPPNPAYPVPVYPVPGYPQPPVYPLPGVENGTATWSGRVDDRANIVIRGNAIYAENVSGNGVQTTYQNMDGSLPRRNSTITVQKSSGRGDVTVIQQPNRSNNFTAIIQVADTKGGSGDYKLDFSWTRTGGNVEEPYRPGSVTWRGRVDQTVNISVAGTSVIADDIAGSGLSGVDFSINGYLANRPGSVNVRKIRGRGTVKVLEQPSWNNGFAAVIQIFDPNGGADNYEIEITW